MSKKPAHSCNDDRVKRAWMDRWLPDISSDESVPLCPTLEELCAFAEGRIKNPALRKNIAKHIEHCGSCAADFSDFQHMLAIERGQALPLRSEPPRRLLDSPFVRTLKDIANSLEFAFVKKKQLTIEVSATIVPDFFKKKGHPFGQSPYEYIAALLRVFAGAMRPADTLLIGADREAFLLHATSFPWTCKIREETLSLQTDRGHDVSSALLLAFYPLWMVQQIDVLPTATRLPFWLADRVKSEVTKKGLRSLTEFFAHAWPESLARPNRLLLEKLAVSIRRWPELRRLAPPPPTRIPVGAPESVSFAGLLAAVHGHKTTKTGLLKTGAGKLESQWKEYLDRYDREDALSSAPP